MDCAAIQAGAEVASLCVGAFLLAATGLVDGKKVPRIGWRPTILKPVFRR